MPDEPVRIGLLGAGFAAATHCQAYAQCLRPRAQVVAVAAGRRSSAEALAARFAIPEVVDDAAALLARDDLEAIDICTPNRSHAPLALAATKRAVADGLDRPLAEGLEAERREFVGLFSSDDAREGITAFLDKREPHWVGV